METENHPKNEIAAALAKAQRVMKPAKLDSKNPHFKNDYASLASTWEACREPLTANNICVVQPIIYRDGQPYCKTVLIHSSGQSLEGEIQLKMGKDDMQGLKSAATYARRLGLSTMAGIPEGDDDAEGSVDHNVSSFSSPPQVKTHSTADSFSTQQQIEPASAKSEGSKIGKKITPGQVKLFYAKTKTIGPEYIPMLLKQFHAEKPEDLTMSEFNSVLDEIGKYIDL